MAGNIGPSLLDMIMKAVRGDTDEESSIAKTLSALQRGGFVAEVNGLTLKAVVAEDEDTRSTTIRQLDAKLLYTLATNPELFETVRQMSALLSHIVERVVRSQAAIDTLNAAESDSEPLPPLKDRTAGKYGDESWMGNY